MGFIAMNNDLSEYEQDFYAWSQQNANLLRQGQLSEIDRLNIAQELNDIGISQLRALESRLTVLLAHLLKWQFQSERQTPPWKYTIIEQRKPVHKILKPSPSLKHHLNETYNVYLPISLFCQSFRSYFINQDLGWYVYLPQTSFETNSYQTVTVLPIYHCNIAVGI